MPTDRQYTRATTAAPGPSPAKLRATVDAALAAIGARHMRTLAMALARWRSTAAAAHPAAAHPAGAVKTEPAATPCTPAQIESKRQAALARLAAHRAAQGPGSPAAAALVLRLAGLGCVVDAMPQAFADTADAGIDTAALADSVGDAVRSAATRVGGREVGALADAMMYSTTPHMFARWLEKMAPEGYPAFPSLG